MKEENRSLIGKVFGKCFGIRLRHMMKHGCELVGVSFFLVDFCLELIDVGQKTFVIDRLLRYVPY